MLAWSYRTEGTFLTGSPVIAGGVVYAGTRDENGEGNSRIHAVDLATGKKLWDFAVPQSIHGSLAVADGLVFAPTLGSQLYAVDARTGVLRWKAVPEAAPAPNNQRTYGYYSPTVASHTVLWPYQTRFGVGSQGVLKALDTRTGRQLWASPMSGATMSDGTPAVADGMVFVGNETADRVLAYDLATGERRWTGAETLGSWQDGVPTAAGGRVFIGANNGISARDARTGATLWTYRSPYSSLVSSGSTPSAPAVHGDVVYMGFPSGAVTALDARTGAVRWDRLLPGDIYHGGIGSSPVVAGDTVFVGSNNGHFYALATDTGQPLWDHEIGTWVGAGPAVSGNTVVAGAWDGNLYAYVPGGQAAPRWATVTGTVTDPSTDVPVDGARVTATAGGQSTTITSTDAQGRYTLGLQPGTWTVTAAKRGLLADDRSVATVAVGSTGTMRADLRLTMVTAPVAGATSIPPDYGSGSTRTDVVAGDRYHYVMNDKVRATITSRTAANNGAGGFRPGALSDLMLNDSVGMETLDWAEMVLAPTMYDPARPWGRSGEWLDLPDITVDGPAVVAAGSAQINAALKTSMRYETLPGAPVVKLTLTIDNTGTSDFTGYFNYLLDPDSSADLGRIPGFAGTDPGFRTSGWTQDFVYVGANAPNGPPAHAVAWAGNEPTGVGAFGYIDGAWWDASVPAGGTKEITFYHVTDYPTTGGDPTGNIARWVDELDLHDPGLPDASRAVGTVTSAGAPAPGVRVSLLSGSAQAGMATTDAQGHYSIKAPAGDYTVRATGLGYQTGTATVSVPAAGNGGADLSLAPVSVEAGTGKRLLGSLAELGFGDIVLENDRLSVGISATFDDPQLSGSTRGKPVDGAVRGREDQLDWINLPYVSLTEPSGSAAWQQRQVQPGTVEVVEANGDRAVVRTTGTIAGIAGLRATTTYTLKPGGQFVTVETVLENSSGAAVHAWTGDAIDHDASGQRSAVSGHPPITISEDRAYPPAGRWIGMTGTDPQVFGLVYADASGPFSAYAAFNWVMSRFEVDIPAGGSYTLTRRLVVAPGSDPAAVLDAVPAP
jgi:outer membrane protein assembly factor BamB